MRKNGIVPSGDGTDSNNTGGNKANGLNKATV